MQIDFVSYDQVYIYWAVVTEYTNIVLYCPISL